MCTFMVCCSLLGSSDKSNYLGLGFYPAAAILESGSLNYLLIDRASKASPLRSKSVTV